MFFCRGFRQPVLPSGLSRLRLSPPTGGTGPGPAPPFAFGTATAPKPEIFPFFSECSPDIRGGGAVQGGSFFSDNGFLTKGRKVTR